MNNATSDQNISQLLQEAIAVGKTYVEVDQQNVSNFFSAEPALDALGSLLVQLPNIDDVGSIHVGRAYFDWDADARVVLYLRKGRQDTPLVRQLVTAFGPAKKQQSADGITATLRFGAIEIAVVGYLPASCRLVEEDVEVPAHVERRTRVVCDEQGGTV